MKRESVFLQVFLIILVTSSFAAFEVQRVNASGNIYIRSNGSVEGTANIQTADNVIYYFTANIYDNIIVERNSIIIDGKGYTLQGTGGVDLSRGTNVTIQNMQIKGPDPSNAGQAGIVLSGSSNNSILGNTMKNNGVGISLYGSSNNNIYGNIITDNGMGMWLDAESSNNSINGNTVTNNDMGIGLRWSSGNSINGNVFIAGGLVVSESYQNVVENNTVNGKPLVYLEDAANLNVTDAGQVILINCDNIRVENLNLSSTSVGVQMSKTNNTLISRNNIKSNDYGVRLEGSSSNSISGNNITDNDYYGISLRSSSNNSISGNTITANNEYGIELRWSSDNNNITGNMIANSNSGIVLGGFSNTVSGNTITNNDCGMSLQGDFNSVSGNTITNNEYGIRLPWSSGNSISENTITNNTYGILVGSDASNNSINGNTLVACGLFSNSFHVLSISVENNTVNGRPLVYLVGVANYNVLDAGQVILVNCTGIRVENLNLSSTSVGVQLMRTNNSIISENTMANDGYGIRFESSSNNSISGNTITNNNYDAIEIYSSSNNSISGNTITNNDMGIELWWSSGNSINGNTVTNNNRGIFLGASSNSANDNIIANNGKYGISLGGASNSSIGGNTITANNRGIWVSQSSNNSISGNTFIADGLVVFESYQNLVENNTVNGKPLVYLQDVADLNVTDAGQVVLVNCTSIRVESLNLSQTSIGVQLLETDNCIISRNTIADNSHDGIQLTRSSNNNTISRNTIANNNKGIEISEGSEQNNVSGNTVMDSNYGIWIYAFSNSLSGNTITNNTYGIRLGTEYNNVSGNTVMDSNYGIWIDYCYNNSINGNTLIDAGLVVWYTYPNFVENNTVNGKPLVYLEDAANLNVTDAGQVILINCDNIRVENLNLSSASVGVQLIGTKNTVISRNNMTANNYVGILLRSSLNNSISGNTIADNGGGIWLCYSRYNNITENNIANNDEGIRSIESSENIIYHNNLVNAQQVNVTPSGYPVYPNVWDDGYPSGGNYWSVYNGTDLDHDGIGDIPYIIDANNIDHYPLMTIIPEFPSFLILSLFIIATLLAVTVSKRKQGVVL